MAPARRKREKQTKKVIEVCVYNPPATSKSSRPLNPLPSLTRGKPSYLPSAHATHRSATARHRGRPSKNGIAAYSSKSHPRRFFYFIRL